MRATLHFCLFTFAFCLIAGCSIPKLESAGCSSARDAAREYYALAIGGEPGSRPEVLEKLKAMRSANFSANVDGGEGRDQFYFSRLQPTAYRVGTCTEQGGGRATLATTVIWRLEGKNSERTDKITLLKTNDAWLVDHIEVGPQPGPDF